MELNDILDDKPEPAPEPAEPSEPAAEPTEPGVQSKRTRHREKEYAAQGRGPDGRFAPKEPEAEIKPEPHVKTATPATATPTIATPTPATPEVEEYTPREKAFLRAAHQEREKRQELERRLAQPTEPAKTFWDDPEAWKAKFQQETQQAVVNTRLNTSESIARSRYQDFDANIAAFAEIAQTTPGMTERMLQAPDPAEFAYQTGKRHLQVKQYGSIEQWQAGEKARIEAEVRAKVEAEYKAKAEADQKAREALPGSLSGTTGARQHAVAWSGPTPLDSILDGK